MGSAARRRATASGAGEMISRWSTRGGVAWIAGFSQIHSRTAWFRPRRNAELLAHGGRTNQPLNTGTAEVVDVTGGELADEQVPEAWNQWRSMTLRVCRRVFGAQWPEATSYQVVSISSIEVSKRRRRG